MHVSSFVHTSRLCGTVFITTGSSVCFETQKMPDAVNNPHFTDTTLNPGEIYDYTTVFKFSVK